jgi:hypothetical protein
MRRENPLLGAPRVRGALMKLGIKISEATVSKYMARLAKPPSQTWRTFFRSHANCLASIDFFVSPPAAMLRSFARIGAGPVQREVVSDRRGADRVEQHSDKDFRSDRFVVLP